MATGVVQVLGVRSEDVVHGREVARNWPDQDFSLVECTSFALMEGRGIEEALAFDAHFRIYRYGEGRRRAFRIVP